MPHTFYPLYDSVSFNLRHPTIFIPPSGFGVHVCKILREIFIITIYNVQFLLRDIAEEYFKSCSTFFAADKSITMNVMVKVVPKVATDWEEIGYCLELRDKEMADIEADVLRSGDVKSACKMVMKTWMRSTHGRSPKTWRTLMTVLEELDINSDSVLEVLQKVPA